MTEGNIILSIDEKSNGKTLIYELFSGVGFCNQLFSLETAIYLANISNRKLILWIKCPLCNCGSTNWDYGKIMEFFSNEYLKYLPNGIEVYYTRNIPQDLQNKINNSYKILENHSFSTAVFIDDELNTDANKDSINNFSIGRNKIIFNIKNFDKYDNLYCTKSNASRCFYNFYTSKNNYILMSKICESLSKLNSTIENYINIINKNLPEDFYSIHFRFGDYHKNTTFINNNNNNISIQVNNILSTYPKKSIFVMTDRKDNEFLKMFKNNYEIIFIDEFIRLHLKDINFDDKNMTLIEFFISRSICYKSELFIGTIGSTVSNYIQYNRYLNNFTYNFYTTKNINFNYNQLNFNTFSWNNNKLCGHPVSWSFFFPDNIYLINNKYYFQNYKSINLQNIKIKKIISYSLYDLLKERNIKRNFYKGVYVNYELSKQIYPNWIIRVYIPKNEPIEIIQSIIKFKNIEIIIIDTNICFRALRFLPYDDNNVSIWLSRDLDSVVNDREKDAVNEWISKYPDKNLHIMADCNQHVWNVAGGMFGYKNNKNNNLINFILKYSNNFNDINKFANDCDIAEKFFLKDNNYIQHYRSGTKLNHSVPFPNLKAIKSLFVGNISDINKYYNDLKLEEKYIFLKNDKKINLFNLDLHTSVIEDVQNIMNKMSNNINIIQWSISGHHWVFNKPKQNTLHITPSTWCKLDLNMIQKFQDEYDEYLKQFDGFIVTHTPVFALLYEKYNKPIFIINSCRYLLPYCWERNDTMLKYLNEHLKIMHDKKQIFIISNNLADHDYLKLGANLSGLYNPSLCLYTNLSYNPIHDKYLCCGREGILPNIPNIVYKKSEFPGRHTWAELYKYKGFFILPYEISTMSIFEYYSANIPLIFPSKEFIKKLFSTGKLHLGSRYFKYSDYPISLKPALDKDYINWWVERADFYNNMKYIVCYNSFEEIPNLLNNLNTENISFKMMMWNQHRIHKTYTIYNNYLINTYDILTKYMPIKNIDISLTVIIPTYPPHFSKLDNIICNICSQTSQPNEVLICASECSNEQAEIIKNTLIKEHSPEFDLRVVNTTEKNNAAENRNRGIKNSNYEYIVTIDSDDFSHIRKFEIIKYLFNKYPETNLICHDYTLNEVPSVKNLNYDINFDKLQLFNDTNSIRQQTTVINKRDSRNTNLAINGNHIHHAHIAFKKSVTSTILFDESKEFARREDGKFCQQTLFQYGGILYVNEKLTLYKPKSFKIEILNNNNNNNNNMGETITENITLNISSVNNFNDEQLMYKEKLNDLQNKYVAHLENSFKNAESEISKINASILAMQGMSGRKTRHFFNNLCSFDDTRYLEIGVWNGSTSCSSLYKNNIKYCTVIDNWSQFGGPKDAFLKNLQTYKGDTPVTVYEMHCFHNSKFGPKTTGQPKPTDLDKFNIYFYDGHHTEDSQYMGLYHYLPCLDDTFIYICDDWNWEKVRKGTMRAIKDANLKILWKKEIRLTWDESHTPSPQREKTWWNGLVVFLFKK